MTKVVNVVAGAILSPCKTKLCISKRGDHLHQGGLWEFPGGKKEEGETPFIALQRELQEELGILVQATEPLIYVEHDYGDKKVALDVYIVSGFSGKPEGMEGQEVRWIAVSDIHDYSFPAANEPIVKALVRELG